MSSNCIMNNFKTGLREKTEDERDIRMGALFSPVSLDQLPNDYEVEIPIEFRKAQEFEDNCAPTAGAIASSLQEGELQDGVFTGGLGRQAAGYDAKAWGMEMRDMANGFIKFGSLNMKDKPDYLTDWHDVTGWNIPELYIKSFPQKKNSYVWVDDLINLDMYDSLRVALYTANKGKAKPDTVILIGTRWPYDTTADIPAWQDGGQGHCYIFSGWKNGKMALSKVERGITMGTWGIQCGDQGKFYIAREVFNKEVPLFGALFFRDETPERLRELIAKGIKLDDNIIKRILIQLYTRLIDLLQQLIAEKQKVEGYPSKLDLWAQAIKEHEGWFIGSRSYRNNNPGNFKFSSVGYLEKYGNVKKDSGGFAIFPTYDQGWMYLTESLRIWATKGNSRYKPDMTITQFFKVYAPYSDGNDPVRYASAVAKKIGVSTFTQIKDLVV